MTIQQQINLNNHNLLAQALARNSNNKEQKPEGDDDSLENKLATIDDFAKIEMRVGEVLSAEVVDGSDKLYKLKVDFGDVGLRTVFSGIRKFVESEELVGKQFPFVTNLAPRKMMGEYSEAMILAASDDTSFALFNPSNKVKNGTQLR